MTDTEGEGIHTHDTRACTRIFTLLSLFTPLISPPASISLFTSYGAASLSFCNKTVKQNSVSVMALTSDALGGMLTHTDCRLPLLSLLSLLFTHTRLYTHTYYTRSPFFTHMAWRSSDGGEGDDEQAPTHTWGRLLVDYT